MSMLGTNGRILCHHTISGASVAEPARHSLAERAEAAAGAGFAGLGLTTAEYEHLLAEGVSPGTMRGILDDHGVAVLEIEFLNGWWADGERLEADRATEVRLYEMADVFGARHMNIGASIPKGEDISFDLLVERYAGVCQRAADHGLLVGLEYMPFFVLSDVEKAWAVVEAADQPNGGLVVDSWHHLHGELGADALRSIPADRVVAVQLSDAVPSDSSLLQRAVDERRWPGEGTLGVGELVRVLDEIGVQAPIGLEVLSAQIRIGSATEIAQAGAASLSRVLGQSETASQPS